MLTSAGNKLLWEGFNSIPQSWRAVAGTRNVSDFKAVTAYRLTTSLEYEEVAPTGAIKHGTMGNETYSMQAKTYAKMAILSRQDIINDDLGAFNDMRQRLGIGAVGKMNKVFWTAWLAARSAGTFWTAPRGNLVTGSALAEAGLNNAVKAFRDMKGPDGFRIGLAPKFVLVPSALEATAKKIFVSTEVRDTTASTKTLTGNIYQGSFEPVVVPELGDSAYTGYSATGWWLMADPKVLASAVMCFLNGVETPTVESADADFDQLGIQFRGYHDFGVAMSEYLASVEAQA
jgi:phage major head subunit gpT-like protein